MRIKIYKLIEENKTILIFLSFAISLRFFLPYMSFASGDISNLMNKYLYLKNGIDFNNLPEITLAIPRFPFVINLFKVSGDLSNYLNLNIAFITKYTAILFEFFVSILVINIYQRITNFKFSRKFYLLLFIIIIINPLSIYINSFLGFYETLWIFFLLLVVYIFEFENQKAKVVYIPIFLALSTSIQPVALIFTPYFYFKNNHKINFIFLFSISFLILNSYFIFSAIKNPILFLNLIETITYAMAVGTQMGEFGMSEIEKLYNLLIGSQSFIAFKLIKFLELIIYGFVYIKLINSKKIKSYEFIFTIFLVTILFNDNLHANYLYWILPFGFIINWRKTLFFSVIICFLVLESETRNTNQLLIFNFLESFSFIQEGNQFENRIYALPQVLINVILFYTAVAVLFEKKILKEIVETKLNIKKILIEFFKFKKVKIISINIYKYSLVLIIFIFVISLNFKSLSNIVLENSQNFENLNEPPAIKNFNSHGTNYEYKSSFNLKNISDIYEIIALSGYQSSIEINGIEVWSGKSILQFTDHRYKHLLKLKQYPLERIKINKYLLSGNNEIKIFSNKPHSIKNFGLAFLLLKNDIKFKTTNDLIWITKKNNDKISYKLQQIKENKYFIEYPNLFDSILEIDKNIKILKLRNVSKNVLVDPKIFLVYIFMVIILINLLSFAVLSKSIKVKEK